MNTWISAWESYKLWSVLLDHVSFLHILKKGWAIHMNHHPFDFLYSWLRLHSLCHNPSFHLNNSSILFISNLSLDLGGIGEDIAYP